MNSWSYSMYSAAYKCMEYYRLVYIDKVTSDSPASGDMAFGSALHLALNSIVNGGEGEQIFEIYWGTYKEKDLDYTRYRWPELRTLGLHFCQKFTKYHAKNYVLEQAEKRLGSVYRDLRFEGTPDFIGTYRGKRSLRDFKTSGYNYAKDKAKVALQLNVYSFLAQRTTGFTPETLGYTVFNKGAGSIQDLTWDFDEKEMYRQLDQFVEYCKIVDQQKSFPKNYNACIMGSMKCNMFEVCHGNKSQKR